VYEVGEETEKVEEKGNDEVEVGPQAYATEDAQDGTEESIGDLPIFPSHRMVGQVHGGIIY